MGNPYIGWTPRASFLHKRSAAEDQRRRRGRPSPLILLTLLPRTLDHRWELGGYLERSKANKRNWILVWEDGFCDFARSRTADTDKDADADADADGPDPSCARHYRLPDALHPELFFKMSHEIYNYGEGDPPERDNRLLSIWHNTIDPQPRTWEAQFKCGIQTIVVVAVQEGLVQLGSNRQILEDLNFVVLLQRKFNSLQQAMALTSSSPCALVSPHPQSTSSLERKMRHSRPDYDEDQPAFTRTLERRLSWTSTADSRRSSRPPPRPLSPNCDSYTFQQQLSLIPLAHDVADHLSNSTSSALPPATLRQWQGASLLESPQADYHAHMQLKASCCSDGASAALSCAASASTCAAPSVLPSMSTLQALLSKLPAAVTTTSLGVLDQQYSIHGKSAVQDHSPLLRTLSAPAPARSTYSAVRTSDHVLPDSTWRNVTPSCDHQLLSFPSRSTDDHHSFLATSPAISPRQHKLQQAAGEADTVANYQSSTADLDIKGMAPIESPVAIVQLQLAEDPEATAALQNRAGDHPSTAPMYCTSPLNNSNMLV